MGQDAYLFCLLDGYVLYQQYLEELFKVGKFRAVENKSNKGVIDAAMPIALTLTTRETRCDGIN